MKKIVLMTLVGLFGMVAKAQDTLGCDLNANFTYSISGGEITFTNTSTGEPADAMYDWWIDDLSSTDENPVFPTTDFEDSETVCFTVYDSLWECHDSICTTIFFDVDSLGCDLEASFTYTISGGEITFTNTSTGEPADAMYDWWIDDLSSTDENPTFPTTDFEDSETVCFTVYDSLWECHDSLCLTIYFDDDSSGCDLEASFTYTISGGEITFTNTSTGEPADAMYDWWIDDLSSTEENPTFPTTDFEDSELVCFTVYDSLWECHDSLCLTIYFDDDSLSDSTASIIQFNPEDVTIYPNPAVDILNISVKNSNAVQRVFVYNAIGEVVRMDQIGLNNSSLEVNVAELAGGIYVVHIVDEENPTNSIQRKFIKK